MQDTKVSPIDWLVDFVIAAGAFGFGLLQLTLSANLLVPDDFMRRMLGIASISPSLPAVMATLITCIPVISRRKLPWVSLAISLGAWVLSEYLLHLASLSLLGPLICLFSLAYYRPREETGIASAITLAFVLTTPLLTPTSTVANLLLLQNSVLTVAVAIMGYALHTRQEYIAEVERRAVEAERTKESEALRRVGEERLRIAREIHDIIAHTLTAVNIQASVADRTLRSDSNAAQSAIANIQYITKSSLEDIRAMIGVLRSADEDAEMLPLEGTDQISSIVGYLDGMGIKANVNESGYDRDAVPVYVDIALFRIAREAATNIVKHSDATSASIELSTSDGMASLVVKDNGHGKDGSATAEGHGISGMRERTRLLGGDFFCGNVPTGGFEVRSQIPLQ